MKAYSESAIQAMSEGLVIKVEQFLVNPKRERRINSLAKYIANILVITGSMYAPIGYIDRSIGDGPNKSTWLPD